MADNLLSEIKHLCETFVLHMKKSGFEFVKTKMEQFPGLFLYEFVNKSKVQKYHIIVSVDDMAVEYLLGQISKTYTRNLIDKN
jgi:hypothetical protein